MLFLDSIPNPVEKNIKGKLADYYSIKSLIYDDKQNYPKVYQSNVLALKYGEEEKKYKIAGEAALELFSHIYFAKKDSTAYKYLDKAKAYYKISNHKYWKLEIEQMEAYVHFFEGNYELCNNLLLDKLDSYKNIIDDDAYFFMFATYMLTSNYIYLDNLEKANYYFNEFRSLKNNQTIVPYNYFSFEVAIYACYADVFIEKKELDLALQFLIKSHELKKFMTDEVLSDYYQIFADYHKLKGDIDASKMYIDSLKIVEDRMFRNVLDASLGMNDLLLETEIDLIDETEENYFNKLMAVLLLFSLLLISVSYFLFYKKRKVEILNIDDKNEQYSYLKNNNEKLKLKVKGLEDYIGEVKKEVKAISSVDEFSQQREKIRELYRNVHVDTSTVLTKNENQQVELVNDLNVDFFVTISSKYPQLSESEVVICYYLHTGFKSKEIAVFMGVTTRSIDSKRYRIRKKLNITERNTSLTDFLSDVIDK